MSTSIMLPVPTKDQRATAKQIAQELEKHSKDKQAHLTFEDGSKVELHPVLVRLLKIATQAMMKGKGIRAIPVSDKITTQAAAEIMGCSRQHVVDLIENGQLKFTKIGTHRRIAFHDLLEFMEKEDKERDALMAEMIDATTEMGGYQSE